MLTRTLLCVGCAIAAVEAVVGASTDEARPIEAGPVAFVHTVASTASTGRDESMELDPESRRSFREEGAWRVNVLAGYGHDFSDAHQFGGSIAVSHFIVDNFSVDFELGGLGFSQSGSDTAGVNLNAIFRWHFLQRDRWSLYGDAGAGILLTRKDVPTDGTSFNFTPQAGVGASWEIGADMHLLVGVRWFHISNARLSSNNPGRDSLHVYAGISLPLR